MSEVTMRGLLTDLTFWDKTFNRLMDKPNISVNEKQCLSDAFTFDRYMIVDRLFNGTYEWSIPTRLELRKSGTTKKRIVYMYDVTDRSVLGLLYHVFSEYYKDRISDFCYSYKTGCNTGQAIKFIRDFDGSLNSYGVKIDIHAYFNNISRPRVKEMLDELFGDSEELSGIKQSVSRLLNDDRCIFHGRLITEYKGVIPGTPLASFFANYCLNECDKHFENSDTIYARYSDDIIIMNQSKEELDTGLRVVEDYVAKYGLTLNEDKYCYFSPGEDITFLGLKLMNDGKIDMSDHSKQKVKKQIHRWFKKGRKEIEMFGYDFMTVAKKINSRLNNKNFKCYIRNEATFGWCHYMFRYITTTESLKEIDLYTKDTIRAMKTGHHNKANYRAVSDEEFAEMKWVSLVQLYNLYRADFDYYCEVISLL